MAKCSFCGKQASQYTGVSIIRNDGTVHFYCSSKCRKNALKLKRDKKNLKWTEFYGVEGAEKAAHEGKTGKEKKEEGKK